MHLTKASFFLMKEVTMTLLRLAYCEAKLGLESFKNKDFERASIVLNKTLETISKALFLDDSYLSVSFLAHPTLVNVLELSGNENATSHYNVFIVVVCRTYEFPRQSHNNFAFAEAKRQPCGN